MILLALELRLLALPEVLHNSRNMGTRDLPDMNVLSPRALGYTYQENHLCLCYKCTMTPPKIKGKFHGTYLISHGFIGFPWYIQINLMHGQ